MKIYQLRLLEFNMAIEIPHIYKSLQDLLSDEGEGFWTGSKLLGAMNLGMQYIYKKIYDATEFAFIEKKTITVVQADIDAKTLEYALPARIIHISNYCDGDLFQRIFIDLRPKYTGPLTAGASDVRMTKDIDYYIGGTDDDKFVFVLLPAGPGTIELFAKIEPTRITSATGTIAMPSIAESAIIEASDHYARRQDENPETNTLLNEQIGMLRDAIITRSGFPRRFQPNWNDVDDFDV